MTLVQYIRRHGEFPNEIGREFEHGWNRIQTLLAPQDRMPYPNKLPVRIKTDYHTMQKGMWAPFGALWMAPDCWDRPGWRPWTAYGFGSNIHEISHPAQWRKLGRLRWTINLAWASIRVAFGRTWHSVWFEAQSKRIAAQVRHAINQDKDWNHRLQTDMKQLLERNDF